MTIMRARSKALNARQLSNNVRPGSPDDACRGCSDRPNSVIPETYWYHV